MSVLRRRKWYSPTNSGMGFLTRYVQGGGGPWWMNRHAQSYVLAVKNFAFSPLLTPLVVSGRPLNEWPPSPPVGISTTPPHLCFTRW
jgi:hypothetical protein